MRLNTLDLIRYGRFENRRLSFPKASRDFHVILGRNEAGKSTTLSAIGDLLFGFPHHKTQDWRFEAGLLRVGSDIDLGTQRLACIRRRGRSGTLRDGRDDGIVDETLLTSSLDGLDRTGFERLWSLDHQRLRQGGAQIAAFRDDLGQQLLSAGFGLAGIRTVLDELETEAATLWKSRSRNALVNAARARWSEAEKSLRDDAVSTRLWKEAQAQRDTLAARQAALQRDIDRITRSLAKLTRIQAVARPLRELAELETSLAGIDAPLFDAADEEAFERGIHALTSARHDIVRCRQAIDGLQPQYDALRPNALLLDDAAAITGLRDDSIAQRSERACLPARERQLLEDDARLTVLAQALGQAAADATSLLARLPDRQAIGQLQALLAERRTLEGREEQGIAQLKMQQQRLAELAPDDETTTPRDIRPLRETVDAVARLGDLDEQLHAARKHATSARRRRDDAFARLRPWSGDDVALRCLIVPDAAQLTDAQQTARRHAAQREESQRQQRAARHDVERLAYERDNLRSRAVVSAEQIAEARVRRDRSAEALRQYWTEGGLFDETRWSSVITIMAEADALADRRFDAASHAARLAQIERDMAAGNLAEKQATETLAAIETAAADAEAAWQRMVQRGGLPPLSPDELQAWLARRDAALAETVAAEDSDTAEQALHAKRNSAMASLRAVLRHAPTGDQLADWLARAGVERGEDDACQARVQRQQQSIEDQRNALRRAEANRSEIAVARTAWEGRWADAARRAGLPPETAADMLTRIDEVRHLAFDVRKSRDAIALTKRSAEAHDAAIAGLAERHGVPEDTTSARLDALLRLLTEAQEAARQAESLKQRLDDQHRNLRDHRAAEHEATSALQPLAERAGTQEPSALREAIVRARGIRALLARRVDKEAQLLELGEGLSIAQLRAEAEQADPDALRADKGHLSEELARLQREKDDATARFGEATESLRQLETRTGAHEAAADAQAALAEINTHAEDYVRSRLQVAILRRIVARQRLATRNPLLQRAGELFSRLTCGRYRGLSVLDDGAPELVGICADGTEMVRVDAMSEGTADQLFLALRLAALDGALARNVALPFVADDLFITFDEARAEAGLTVLGDMAERTQVLFLTHHAHIAALAKDLLDAPVVELDTVPV
ncbi:hypothetical protein AA101099_2230 [Neoasaia chiangmaiensis NBRC 101099]|uniref:YhaN AAA domain-containing protein n=1 Tax=Neoasaia chiangmaiensis TaxID=320497 RepID=A0A1U9KSW6_9PROT|nr:YhaN family protein [Neoasaia chiangmaiensis]AQS88819.1 hypothetical protein A0U93_13780 [Neoasaia chiangmaiensis]GBR40696.1 hypothetical protein AA101099_2230 [Neoasaia chiangmaiensis NBRC 101099]GEN13783.1 hypothetical protein NCH01_02140 [Neoasaia chiangmaiensis]